MPYVRIGPTRHTSVLMRDRKRRPPFRYLVPWNRTFPSQTTYPGPGTVL